MQIIPKVTKSGGSESVIIAGATGSGKSNLARFFIKLFVNAVILDAKDEISLPGFTRINNIRGLINSKEKRIVFSPTAKELGVLLDNKFEPFYQFIFLRSNTAVLIDENNFVNTTASNPQYWQLACYTRGRSKNLTMITCTQRPFNLPQVIMTESAHFWAGRLISPSDRERVSGFSGLSVARIEGLLDYQFLHSYKGKPDKQVYQFEKQ